MYTILFFTVLLTWAAEFLSLLDHITKIRRIDLISILAQNLLSHMDIQNWGFWVCALSFCQTCQLPFTFYLSMAILICEFFNLKLILSTFIVLSILLEILLQDHYKLFLKFKNNICANGE